MDHVRDKDVDKFDRNGGVWVRAGTGGISTSEIAGPIGGKWWRLDAGFSYSDLLLVWNDYDRHWSWEPVQDMPLRSYEMALRSSNSHFRKAWAQP